MIHTVDREIFMDKKIVHKCESFLTQINFTMLNNIRERFNLFNAKCYYAKEFPIYGNHY